MAQSLSIIFLLKGGFIRESLPLLGKINPDLNFIVHFSWAILTVNILRLFRVFSVLPHIFICSMSLFLLLLFYLTSNWPVFYDLVYFMAFTSLIGTFVEIKNPIRGRRLELLLAFYGFGFLIVLLTTKIKGTGVLLYSMPILFIIHPVIFICYLLISSFIISGLHKRGKESNREIIRHYWRVTSKNIALFFILFNLNIQALVLLRHFEFSLVFSFMIAMLGIIPLLNFGYKMFISSPERIANEHSQSKIKILGLTIDNISRVHLLSEIEKKLKAGEKTFIVTPDTLAILRSQTDREYYENVAKANYRLPDGIGVVWASNMVGTPIIERLPGVEIFEDICSIAAKLNKTVYLLGARKRVVEDAAFNLVQKDQNLKIVGFHDGFFEENSAAEKHILEEIKTLKPDIIFVAMGVPRQENWIAKHCSTLPPTLFMGIGGSFDVLSGRIKRAPLAMQNLGLEWLYRLYLEPSRLTKVVRIPLFIFKIIEFNLESSYTP
ncbi:WecB/TagA/CpsF family glycosyltransferase [Candidatus Riflebacteria bacterium]